MKKILCLAMIGAFSTSGALAADLVLAQTPAPVSYTATSVDWTGFYAGLNGGYASGEVSTPTVGDFDVDGGVLGAQVGYNYNFGSFVLGAEADIQWTGIEGGVVAGALATEVAGQLDYFGTVRLRAGVAMDSLLPYITGGFAYGGASATSSFGTGYSTDETLTGYTVGAGAEYAVTENVSVKGEYLYTDFADQAYFGDTIIEQDVGQTFHTVRAGVNFSF